MTNILSPYWCLVSLLAVLSDAQTINPYLQQQYSAGSSSFNFDYYERMYDDGILPPKTNLESLESTGKYAYDASEYVPEATGLFEKDKENIFDLHSFQANDAWNTVVPFHHPPVCQVPQQAANEYEYQRMDRQDPDSGNSFLSNYHGKVFVNEMMPSSTNFGSADKYVHDSPRFVAETPGLFEGLNDNVLNQDNLQFNTALNPAVPAQQPFLQPSLWQVPECTGNRYWSLDTNISDGNVGGKAKFAHSFPEPAGPSRFVTADSGFASDTVNHLYRNLYYSNNEGYGESGSHDMTYGGVATGETCYAGRRELSSEPCSNSAGFYPEANSYFVAQPGQCSLPTKAGPSVAIAPQARWELPHRHSLKHTGIRPFKCDHCHADFYRGDKLKEHLKRNHSTIPECQQRQAGDLGWAANPVELMKSSGRSMENSTAHLNNLTVNLHKSVKSLNESMEWADRSVSKPEGKSTETCNESVGSSSKLGNCKDVSKLGWNLAKSSNEALKNLHKPMDSSGKNEKLTIGPGTLNETVACASGSVGESKESAGKFILIGAECSEGSSKGMEKSALLMEKPKDIAQNRMENKTEGTSEFARYADKIQRKLARKPENSGNSDKNVHEKCKPLRKSSAESLKNLKKSSEKSRETSDGLKETAQKSTQSVTEKIELCREKEYGEADEVVEVTTVPTEMQQYSCHWNGRTLKFTRIREPDRSFFK